MEYESTRLVCQGGDVELRTCMCTRVFVCAQIGQGVLNEGGFKVLSSCVLGLRHFLIFS